MPGWPWARAATDAAAAEATVGAIYRSSTGSVVQRKRRRRQPFCPFEPRPRGRSSSDGPRDPGLYWNLENDRPRLSIAIISQSEVFLRAGCGREKRWRVGGKRPLPFCTTIIFYISRWEKEKMTRLIQSRRRLEFKEESGRFPRHFSIEVIKVPPKKEGRWI